jgi:hypothetical protein
MVGRSFWTIIFKEDPDVGVKVYSHKLESVPAFACHFLLVRNKEGE